MRQRDSSHTSFTMRDVPAQERPREKLRRDGAQSLDSDELLAVILGRGGGQKPLIELVRELLSRFGDLEAVTQASLEELMEIKGIGLAKACQIKALGDFWRRIEHAKVRPEPGKAIGKASDIAALICHEALDLSREHFFVIMLDSRGRYIRHEVISEGSLNATVVHPREVFAAAISARAASVIFVHNHPSTDPEPSDDDIALTRRLVNAGQLMGIPVHDHIITTRDPSRFVSMRSRNLI